jgi:glycine cleavage system H protein
MTPSTHHIIPEGERYCIWMDAGVVDYKLCTLHFKCDECPFDAQLRADHRMAAATNVESSGAAAGRYAMTLQKYLRSVESEPLPDDRLYASNHTWVKEDGNGSYVLGVDHFISTLLAGAHSVAFSVPPMHIQAAEPYAWIVANGETLAVRSPIAGTIVENNPELSGRASVLHSDPYAQGWIVKIRPERAERPRSMQPANRFATILKKDAERFEKTFRSNCRDIEPGSAATMYDGGAAVSTFEDMLGTKKMFEILDTFLRSHK